MRTRYLGLPGLATLLLTGCASGPSASDVAEAAVDVHSHSRPDEVLVTHVALDLRLDFENKQVHGLVELYLERPDLHAPLVLDTAGLTIEEVTGPGGSERSFQIGTADPILGTPLTIELLAGDHQVRVRYHTNPDAAALQWLEPAQTRGGAKPFLYTQGQAILSPLSTELVATEDGKAMALEMYAEFRPLYHSISTRGLDQLLGWRR